MTEKPNDHPRWLLNAINLGEPRPKPPLGDCQFYHAMDFPSGHSVTGAWDIRGRFSEYIGNYPLADKTVLDVGTASGFLAFKAEQAGAAVTAIDALHATEFERLPFGRSLHQTDRIAWARETEGWYATLKNGFWYAWHEFRSGVEVIYIPLDCLPFWGRQFDVIIAGAILEHLANPIVAIGNIAPLAKEAVIIAFMPVEDSDEQIMRTANDWSNPDYSYTWWTISRGLYRRVFGNLGFDVEFKTAHATTNGTLVERPTLIARRRS